MRNVTVKKTSPLIKLYLLPPIMKLLLAFFVVVFCSSISFFMMYQQSKNELRIVNIRKKEMSAEVVKEAKSYGQLSYLSKTAPDAKKRYEDLIKLLPPESSVGNLLAEITKLGTENGLRFIYFRPTAGEVFGYYAAIPIDISVVGQFHQIATFLSGIANLPGSVVAVNQFLLMHSEKSDSNLLTLQFRATLYYSVPTSLDVKV